MRSAFIRALTQIASEDSQVVVMAGDLGFKIFDECRLKIGPRFVNAGVSEANMVSVAAGMALRGKRVYCYSIAPFVTMRAFEQIRVDVCAHNLPVRIVGVGGALAYALEGVSHHALEDVALMRSLSHTTVVVPADAAESAALAWSTALLPGPVYIRLAKDEPIAVHEALSELAVGKGIVLRPVKDVTLVVNGPILSHAVQACDMLRESGFDVGLVSMPTVKPLDAMLIRTLIQSCNAVFTVEEHSKTGGFGSALTDALVEHDFRGIIRRLALPDTFFSEIGGREHLRAVAGIDALSIAEALRQFFTNMKSQLREVA